MMNGLGLNVRGRMALGITILGLLAMFGSTNAYAGIELCQLRIDVVEADLNGTADGSDCSAVVILGGNPSRTCASLNSKLDSASRKLDQIKLEDAYVNLSDFIGKVQDLNTPNAKGQTKIADGETTVEQLLQDAELALQCVGGL